MKPFSVEDNDNIGAWMASLDQIGGIHLAPEVPAVLIPCQDEFQWLAQRKDGIGASEIGVIMGASKWTSTYALWWRKKLDWRLPTTEAQTWGHLVEDPITALFANEMAGHLYIAKPLCHPYSLWRHEAYGWAMCTPDRLAVTDRGDVVPVEIKSDEGGPGWGEPGTDEVPAQYRYQALWQAFVFGAAGTYVVRKRGSGRRRMVWYWVPYDEEATLSMLVAAADFLSSIEAGAEPDPDGSAATTEMLQAVNAVMVGSHTSIDHLLYAEWSQARENKRAAIEQDRLLSNQMRAAMGTAEFATTRTTDGLDVVRVKRRVGKRDGYTVAPTTTDELREVSSGHGEANPGVPSPGRPDHSPAAPPADPQGSGDSSAPGGAGTGTEASAEDPGGTALVDVLADVRTADGIRVVAGDISVDNLAALIEVLFGVEVIPADDPQVRADVISHLPDELARLVHNAVEVPPLGIDGAPAEPDRGCET